MRPVSSQGEVTERRVSRFNAGHGGNTYTSGAEIGDKQIRTVQTRQEDGYQNGKKFDVFGSYPMQIEFVIYLGYSHHLLDTRFYCGGDH